MVVNLNAERYRKAAEEIRELQRKHKNFLTQQEWGAFGCAAHRAEAEANLIERLVGGSDARD